MKNNNILKAVETVFGKISIIIGCVSIVLHLLMFVFGMLIFSSIDPLPFPASLFLFLLILVVFLLAMLAVLLQLAPFFLVHFAKKNHKKVKIYIYKLIAAIWLVIYGSYLGRFLYFFFLFGVATLYVATLYILSIYITAIMWLISPNEH